MSRFEDLEDFLALQEATEAEACILVVQRREQSKATHDPLIRKALEVFTDFHTTIGPRTGLIAIPKSKEAPDIERVTNDPIYRYLVNLVPHDPKTWPYRMSEGEAFTYRFYQPGGIEHTEWHPNVAAQLSVSLYSPWIEQAKQYSNNLRPQVSVYVWGVIPEQEGMVPSDEPFTISHGNAWNRNYSVVTLQPDKDQLDRFESGLTFVLKLVTPNVLNHKTLVRG